LAGIGVSALPCFVTSDHPSLVRLTPTVIARSEAFLAIPPDHRTTVRVHLVMEAVIALFEPERSRLEGAV